MGELNDAPVQAGSMASSFEPLRLSARQGVYFVSLLLLLLSFAGLLAFELIQSRDRELDIARRDVETLSRALEGHVTRTIEKIDVLLQETASDFPQLKTMPAAEVNALLQRRLALIPESQSLRIANAKGRFIYDATGKIPQAVIDDRAYFLAHRDNPDSRLIISEPIFARITHNWVVTVSRRLVDRDGHFVGLVQAAIRAEFFQSFYRTLSVGRDGVVALYDSDVRMIARHPEQIEKMGKPVRGTVLENLLQAAQTSGSYTTVSPVDGIERLHGFRKAPGLPFVVLVGKSVNEVLSEWRKTLVYYLVAVIFLLLALLTLLRHWQRNYTSVLQRANALQAAYGDSVRQSEALLNSLPDPAWLRDAQGVTLAANPAYLALCGQPREAVIGQSVETVWQEPMASVFRAKDRTVLAHGIQLREEGMLELPDGSRHYYEFVRTPVKDAAGATIGIAGFARDVTERKHSEDRARYLAEHDPLTDLPNRLQLSELMNAAIAGLAGTKMRLALLCLDLDQFKNVNDSLGHALGDRLLQQVAERLRGALQTQDTVSRQGGDEFAILLVNCANTSMIALIAQRLLDVVAQSFQVDHLEFNLTASIGISIYPDDGDEMGALLQNADAAMYSAKNAGRNRYRFFKPEMNQRIAERMQIESKLRKALEQGEFLLHYQPQLCCRTGVVVGAEALLRWQQPGKGLLPPAVFIPVAEETGLIVAIGQWVLQEACRQNVLWQRAGLPPLVIAVNLSAVQFRTPGLVRTVLAALTDSGLEPRWLELEITESVMMDDAERVLEIVRELRQLGVRLSIDDFGTGYSSFSYLKRFPVDKLKIDRSFVDEVASNPDDLAIANAIVNVARSLGMATIAEGVETAEQLHVLRHLGCDEAQGYLLARPVPASEFMTTYRGSAARAQELLRASAQALP